MAQPPAYNRLKDFTENFGDETDHSALNAELDKAANSINDIRANLAILQADDGKLRPAVVTSESVSQTLKDELTLNVTMDVQPVIERALIAEQQAKTALENSQIAINTANQASVDASNAVTKADDADLRATEAMDSAEEAVNFSLQARHLSEVAERDSSSALVTVTTLQENLPQNIENEVTKQVGQELIGTVETIVREVTSEIVEETAASKDYVDGAVSTLDSSLATVAKSGSYSDLSNKPTNVSSFTNDAGYLTQHQSLADYATKSQLSGYLPRSGGTMTGTLTGASASFTSLTVGGSNIVAAPTSDVGNATTPVYINASGNFVAGTAIKNMGYKTLCTTAPTTTSSASTTNVATIVSNYRNGADWWRVWSDGFIEQGGILGTGGASTTVTFKKPFSDANYTFTVGVTSLSGSSAFNYNTAKAYFGSSATKSNITIHAYAQHWYACGY